MIEPSPSPFITFIASSLALTLFSRFPAAVFTSDILSAIFLSTEPSWSTPPFNTSIAFWAASTSVLNPSSIPVALVTSSAKSDFTWAILANAEPSASLASVLFPKSVLNPASTPLALVASAAASATPLSAWAWALAILPNTVVLSTVSAAVPTTPSNASTSPCALSAADWALVILPSSTTSRASV